VEAKVETLLVTIDEDTPVNFQPCDISKEMQYLKSGEACGFSGIPAPASSKKTSCAFNIFIQSLHSAWPLPSTLERSINYNPAETWQRQNFTQIYVQSASCPQQANYLRS
jgi:hypothetical protein